MSVPHLSNHSAYSRKRLGDPISTPEERAIDQAMIEGSASLRDAVLRALIQINKERNRG